MMFERFTDRSRRIIILAQEECRLLPYHEIGVEFLWGGVIAEGGGVAAQVLEDLDITLDDVRSHMPPRDLEASKGHIPFTDEAKAVLELALREALQLGHNYIGTEHILLALIRYPKSAETSFCAKLGLEAHVVRQAVIEKLSGYAAPQRPVKSSAPPLGPIPEHIVADIITHLQETVKGKKFTDEVVVSAGHISLLLERL
jgi:ATP-dependent Clp protease ATP-binding subunit ClpC